MLTGRLCRRQKTPILNGYENILENEAFAQHEQILHFPKCLPQSFATNVIRSKCVLYIME